MDFGDRRRTVCLKVTVLGVWTLPTKRWAPRVERRNVVARVAGSRTRCAGSETPISPTSVGVDLAGSRVDSADRSTIKVNGLPDMPRGLCRRIK